MAAPVKNIVLVHGAWVNGAGWKPVYEILVKEVYNVSVAEHPLTSFNDDVTAVERIIAMQDGPTILVGHSYGGCEPRCRRKRAERFPEHVLGTDDAKLSLVRLMGPGLRDGLIIL
jgi:predicted alpha/beta hydrolase family esterase